MFTAKIPAKLFIYLLLALQSGTSFYCTEKPKDKNEEKSMNSQVPANADTATFGSGCFWCTEAIFERVKGVVSVESGYSGGSVENPTYQQVCDGNTGHAEVCRITFDPEIITYEDLLEIFWKTHDPTTPNQQGNDVGTQYRSVVYYHTEKQKELAEYYKGKLDSAGIYAKHIVTEITAEQTFYKAENYHQNYYDENPEQGYCNFVITPKVEKFKKVFKEKLAR